MALGHLYSDFSGPSSGPSMFGLFKLLFLSIFGHFRAHHRFTKVSGHGDLFNKEREGGSGPLLFGLVRPLFGSVRVWSVQAPSCGWGWRPLRRET